MRRRNIVGGESFKKENGNGAPRRTASRILSRVSKLDMYPKLHEDVKVRTRGGGALSLVVALFASILFFSELSVFLSPVTTSNIAVDDNLSERMSVSLNISFWALSCDNIELVAMDVAGEHNFNVEGMLKKTRLSSSGKRIEAGATLKPLTPSSKEDGNDSANDEKPPLQELPADYCGPCYGAKTNERVQCCNTCDQLLEAYERIDWDTKEIIATAEQCIRERAGKGFHKGEGCSLEGKFSVQKVSGNFHVAMGRSRSIGGSLVHNFDSRKIADFDASHTVHHLSFGRRFPGQRNSLDGHRRIVDPYEMTTATYQYHVNVVPTVYKDASDDSEESALRTNQYTYQEMTIPIGDALKIRNETENGKLHAGNGHAHPRRIALPGVFFIYDISPFVVHTTKSYVPTIDFIARLCAIIGGTYTILGLVDSILYRYRIFGERSNKT